MSESDCSKACDESGIDFEQQASNANCYYYSRHEVSSANEVIDYLEGLLYTSSQITKSFETELNYPTWLSIAENKLDKWIDGVKYKKVSGYSDALAELGFTSKIIKNAMKDKKSDFNKLIEADKIVNDVDI